jgi:hypothetical protein
LESADHQLPGNGWFFSFFGSLQMSTLAFITQFSGTLQSDSKAPGSPVFSCRTAGAKPSQSLAYSETTKAILDSSQKFFEDLLKRGDPNPCVNR